MKMSTIIKSSLLIVLTFCLIAEAADRNIALEADITSNRNNSEMLVNGATDPDGSYTTDYNPAGTSTNVAFEWDQAMAISQFRLYKKIGGTASGYTAPGATRLVAIDDTTLLMTQKFYYFEDETGVWGVNEDPILTLLEVNFDPPIVVHDDEQFLMTSWVAVSEEWILMDEVEIFGQEHVGCGDPCTVYITEDINGDCIVDLDDIALIAGSWSQCTDPCDTGCDSYWPSVYDPNTLPPGY